MSVKHSAPGPVGATCYGCIFGPKDRDRNNWFCKKMWAMTSSTERACAEYDPRNGQVTDPMFPNTHPRNIVVIKVLPA